MRSKFLLLAMLLPFFLQAQEPCKKCNAAYLSPPPGETVEELWRRAAQAIIAAGFPIAQTDHDFLYLKSDVRELGHGVRMRVEAAVVGERVRLRGEFELRDLPGWSDVRNSGMRGSPARLAWDELERLARTIPAAGIEFRRE